ncbi:MAG: hypothetical protein NC388_04490 [Clostridium sp.]|nr:hypothetical protein [Clostridium sp.]
MTNKMLNAVRLLMLFAGIFLYVLSYVIYGRTLVEPAIPLLVTVGVVALTWPLLCGRWQWLTQTEDATVDMLCHLFVTGAVACGAFLPLNDVCIDETSVRIVAVEVEDKHVEERRNTRRIGRRRYLDAGVTREYYIRVRWEGGEKELRVSLTDYNRLRHGGEAQLELKDGCWGLPVVTGVGSADRLRGGYKSE